MGQRRTREIFPGRRAKTKGELILEKKFIFAGFGGQGIMMMGQLLSQAAVLQGLEVAYTQSYGSEMRGGTAKCAVVVSDEKIGSPIVTTADAYVVMNLPSFNLIAPVISPKSILIINSSLVNAKVERTDIWAIEVPATEIANQMGNSRGSNLVALGAFVEATHIVKPQSIINALKQVLPPHRLDTLALNVKSFDAGRNCVLKAVKK
jgi:2-oxoglutarate ferredoxin oxidoreductase subunit gamma